MKGFIHRDIKPSNILYNVRDSDISVVLADFGLSMYMNFPPLIYDEIIHSSQPYRAPEVFLKITQYSYEQDIWSLGITFLHLFIGTYPTRWSSSQDTLTSIVELLGNVSTLKSQSYIKRDSLSKFVLNMNDIDNPTINQYTSSGLITPEQLQVLSNMLNYDPNGRLMPFELIQLPYFDDVRTNIYYPQINIRLPNQKSSIIQDKSIRQRGRLLYQNYVFANLLDEDASLYHRSNEHTILQEKVLTLNLMQHLFNINVMTEHTLSLSITLLDTYLIRSNFSISKDRLNLLGVSCLYIAAKITEEYNIPISDYVPDPFNWYEVLDMERRVLTLVPDVNLPSTDKFLDVYRMYLYQLKPELRTKIIKLTKSYIDIGLLNNFNFTFTLNNLVSSALFIATSEYDIHLDIHVDKLAVDKLFRLIKS